MKFILNFQYHFILVYRTLLLLKSVLYIKFEAFSNQSRYRFYYTYRYIIFVSVNVYLLNAHLRNSENLLWQQILRGRGLHSDCPIGLSGLLPFPIKFAIVDMYGLVYFVRTCSHELIYDYYTEPNKLIKFNTNFYFKIFKTILIFKNFLNIYYQII